MELEFHSEQFQQYFRLTDQETVRPDTAAGGGTFYQTEHFSRGHMPETTACNMLKVSQLASGLGLQVICGYTILVSYFG